MWKQEILEKTVLWSLKNFDGKVRIEPGYYDGPLIGSAYVKYKDGKEGIHITNISEFQYINNTDSILESLTPLVQNWIQDYEAKA